MKLVKNMAYSTIYQVIAVLMPLITIPYVSRVLGPEGIGINAVTNANVTYFMLLANLGIQMYGNREIAYHQQKSEARSKIFWELVLLKLSAALVSGLAYGSFVLLQNHWTFFYSLQAINLLAVLFDISWFFMGIENFRIIALQNTAIKLLTIIGTFALVHKAADLWIYIFLLAISTFLGNLAVWPFLKTEIAKVPFRKLQIYKHFKPAMALFLPQIMITVYLSLNKTMLGSLHSVKSAGYFTQSDSIIRVAYTLTSSFSDAFLPRLSNMASKNKIQEIKGLTLKSLELSNAVGIMIISGIVGVSSSFAIYFFGADFASVGPLMAVESLVILFISWGNVFGKQFLLSTRQMKPYILSSVIGLTINVIINLILIPSMGAMGAVIATLLTELGVGIYQIWSVRDIFSFKEIFLPLWKYLLAGLISFLAVFILNQQMSVGLMSYFIQALVCIFAYLLVIIFLGARLISLVRDFLINIRK